MKYKFLPVFFTLLLTGALMVSVSAHAGSAPTDSCVGCTISASWGRCCAQHPICELPACPCNPAPPVDEPPALPDVPETPDEPTVPDEPSVPDLPDAGGSIQAVERQVAALVNQERTANGLRPLQLSAQLSDGARLKSQDMKANGYFDHNSPTYGSPFDMMASLGISYSAAAENIAMGQKTAEAVMAAWMSSAGHRANILSEKYTAIGVGYVAAGNYWTQWFTR